MTRTWLRIFYFDALAIELSHYGIAILWFTSVEDDVWAEINYAPRVPTKRLSLTNTDYFDDLLLQASQR